MWTAEYKKNYFRADRAKRAKRNLAFVTEIKAAGCMQCGEKRIDCLEFHHLGGKDQSIARLCWGSSSLKRIKVEIEKCIILCANCHLCLHAEKRRNNIKE